VGPPPAAVPVGCACSSVVSSTGHSPCREVPVSAWLLYRPQPLRDMVCLLILYPAVPLFPLSAPLLPPPLSSPFLKYVSLEVPPASLKVSAVSCGSVVELAGTRCVQHGRDPHLFPQRSSLQPLHCQNLGRYTQCISLVRNCDEILYSSSFLI